MKVKFVKYINAIQTLFDIFFSSIWIKFVLFSLFKAQKIS